MIYFLQRKNGDIKIGTTKTYNNRIAKLAYEHGSLKMIGLIDGSYEEEYRIHEMFAATWTGDAEWFSNTPELIAFIAAQKQIEPPVKRVLTDEHIEFKRSLRKIRKGHVRKTSSTSQGENTAPLHFWVTREMRVQITEYAVSQNITDAEAIRQILTMMLDGFDFIGK